MRYVEPASTGDQTDWAQVWDEIQKRRTALIPQQGEQRADGGFTSQPAGLLTDPHTAFVMNPQATGAGAGQTAAGNVGKILSFAA